MGHGAPSITYSVKIIVHNILGVSEAIFAHLQLQATHCNELYSSSECEIGCKRSARLHDENDCLQHLMVPYMAS